LISYDAQEARWRIIIEMRVVSGNLGGGHIHLPTSGGTQASH
jgi:hypothetical protein